MIKDQKDIVLTINHGLSEYEIEFVQQIEQAIDNSLAPLGFTRSLSSKESNKCEFVYYQFAKGL